MQELGLTVILISEGHAVVIPIAPHLIMVQSLIDHFTVLGLVTWPLNVSEAGVDLVLIQTSLLLLCKSSCS